MSASSIGVAATPAAGVEDPAGLGDVRTVEDSTSRRSPTGMDHPRAMNSYGARAAISLAASLVMSRVPFFGRGFSS